MRTGTRSYQKILFHIGNIFGKGPAAMLHTETNTRLTLPSRRNFIAATTTAAAALAATTQTSQAFLFRQSTPAVSLQGLPSGWIAREGETKIQSYADYLAGLRLKYVTPLQVVKAHAKSKRGLWNSLPPKSMWRSMAGTLQAVDRVCSILGQPVKTVTSAYRSPGYNRRCPGAASRSLHMQNFALDLQFRKSPRSVASAARYVRSKGFFSGGIGRYSSFVHIDTRGTNIDW